MNHSLTEPSSVDLAKLSWPAAGVSSLARCRDSSTQMALIFHAENHPSSRVRVNSHTKLGGDHCSIADRPQRIDITVCGGATGFELCHVLTVNTLETSRDRLKALSAPIKVT